MTTSGPVLSQPRTVTVAVTAALWLALVAALLPAPAAAAPPPRAGTVIPGRYIVTLDSGADVPATARAMERGGGVRAGHLYRSALRGFSAELTPAALRRLRADRRVLLVEEDRVAGITATQSSPPWGLDRIDQAALPLDRAYTAAQTGAGVRVYVLDTGIRAHQDFTGRLAAGYTAISDGNGTDDCNGHGTHVAGTVAGSTHGVAKQATLIPVRVLGCDGSGTLSGVIAGLDWVTATRTLPAVANLSLGGGTSRSLDDAVRRTIASGVTVTVAAGNAGADACTISPARVAEALTVGATSSNDAKPSWSNFGTCLDLFAPGASITSTGISSSTATTTMSGTSMAAPHVAGVAAQVLEAAPATSPAEVAGLVRDGATQGVVTGAGTGSPNLLLRLVAPATAPAPPTGANSAPTALATVTCSGATCGFSAAGSSDVDGTITGYRWSFSDGPTASGVSVSRTFTGAGTHTGTVTVTDDGGATASASAAATCGWSGKGRNKTLSCATG